MKIMLIFIDRLIGKIIKLMPIIVSIVESLAQTIHILRKKEKAEDRLKNPIDWYSKFLIKKWRTGQ